MAKKFFENFEEILCSFFLLATLFIVLANIFMRYFLKTGLSWAEEITTTCFVWTVYIGAAAAYKKSQHIGIDLVVKYLSGGARKAVQISIDVLLVILLIFIAYLSFKYAVISHHKTTAVIGISSSWVSSAIPAGFILMVIRTFQFFIRDWNTLQEEEERR